ncbi:hypothetical protein M422DRAFT_241005 [Sphaerobolus stellatus SS14]|nr:hypothetical protein M422DRAFT_241005 [Sphaerobolus stellatus SS14]
MPDIKITLDDIAEMKEYRYFVRGESLKVFEDKDDIHPEDEVSDYPIPVKARTLYDSIKNDVIIKVLHTFDKELGNLRSQQIPVILNNATIRVMFYLTHYYFPRDVKDPSDSYHTIIDDIVVLGRGEPLTQSPFKHQLFSEGPIAPSSKKRPHTDDEDSSSSFSSPTTNRIRREASGPEKGKERAVE